MTESLISKDCLLALTSFEKIWIGFSGGLDSTVLLHQLAQFSELIPKLRAVHIHHGLSPHATAWQEHCESICKALFIPLVVHQVTISSSKNIEEQARLARHDVFAKVVTANDVLLLAHHANDQAETFLLQLMRGSGVDGLAAMAETSILQQGTVLLRPLLKHSRQRLLEYANSHHLPWVEDESNENTAFSRNYLRREVLPLLEKKWPGAISNLGRAASHCQTAKTNLDILAELDCIALKANENHLVIAPLLALSRSRIMNVLRVWFRRQGVRQLSLKRLNQFVDAFVFSPMQMKPHMAWGEIEVRRYQGVLYLINNMTPVQLMDKKWVDFPSALTLENGVVLSAKLAKQGLAIPPQAKIEVRYRDNGEQFYWHGQHKSLKKLFQEWKIPSWERRSIPLLYINNTLACVVGFAISDLYNAKDDLNQNLYTIEVSV